MEVTRLTTSTGASNIMFYKPVTVNDSVTASYIYATSDYRIKENVRSITQTVNNLRPVQYYNIKSEKEDLGLIAHELQEEFPMLVTGEKDGKEMQSINYTGLIAVLIKEIQDLKKRVAELESKI